MTSRELVYQTLSFQNKTNRIPRQMWILPWATLHHKEMYEKVMRDFPPDIEGVSVRLQTPPLSVGDPFQVGTYVDEWGCTFTNITPGIIGEVKKPLIAEDDMDWDGAENVHIPEELLSFDIDQVNRACAESDLFVTGGCCPRPFEQLQFIRSTENLYMDLLDPPPKMTEFIKKMHDFYCQLLTKWAKTDVDALNFMDDWGSQNSLLINPKLWCEIFKPMYRDYIQIAHSHNKKVFMHSDGYILEIFPHLTEMGLDAINCQIFCMGVDKLAPFRGKITFWGEMDRQHLLATGTAEEIETAVRQVYETLWADGGCIAQLEFGPGANPQNVYHAFKVWDKLNR